MTRHNHLLSALLFVASSGMAMAQTGVPGAQFLATWDTNGDGTVTLEEATALRSEIFATYDVNGDGLLSSDERAAMDGDQLRTRDMIQLQDQTQTQTSQGSGKKQGQGSGSKQSTGPGSNATVRSYTRTQLAISSIDAPLAGTALDTNGDGYISLAEFLAGTADWLDRLDRNGDGVITSADFGN